MSDPIEPTADDLARDLRADLERAQDDHGPNWGRTLAAAQQAYGEFAVLVLETALRRAIAAETELAALREMLAGDGGKVVSLIEGRLQVRHWAVRLLSCSLGESFLELGGVNCVEMEVGHPELGPLLVTIQRKRGKSPLALKGEAEAEVERLRAEVAEYEAAEQRAREVNS